MKTIATHFAHRDGRLSDAAHVEARKRYPNGYTALQFAQCSFEIFGGSTAVEAANLANRARDAGRTEVEVVPAVRS